MITITENLHDVQSVKATRLYPSNGNAVSIAIELGSDSGGAEKEITLFFGQGPHAANKAQALFYSLGGKPEDVVRDHG